MTPFSRVLLLQPPGPTTLLTSTLPATDANSETPRKALRRRLIFRITKMQHNTEKWSKAPQQRYKWHHDGHIREETRFHVGQLVHVDRPPLLIFTADKMTIERYSKFFLCSAGPYCGTSKTSHSITVDQNWVSDTISSDQVSLVPTHMQQQDVLVDGEFNHWLPETSVRNPGNRKDQPRQSIDIGTQTQEYTVYHIFKHVGNARQKEICGAMVLDTLYLTKWWSRSKTSHNTWSTCIGRMSKKREIISAQSTKSTVRSFMFNHTDQ